MAVPPIADGPDLPEAPPVGADDSLVDKLRYWRAAGAPGRLRRQGTVDTRSVTNELTGGVAGTQTHHWSGRVDANVTPDPTRIIVPLSSKERET